MKKAISLFLALVMLVSVFAGLGITAYAADAQALWVDPVNGSDSAAARQAMQLHFSNGLRAAAAKVMGRAGNPAAGKLLNDPFKVVRLQAEWALRDSLPPDSPGMKELTAAALHTVLDGKAKVHKAEDDEDAAEGGHTIREKVFHVFKHG